MAKIVLESEINNDKYTQYIYDNYDIQNQEKTIVEVPLNFSECKSRDWEIGAVLGKSGSGKSTILKHMGEIKIPTYDNTKAIISNFPWLEEEEVCQLFTSVGLSSIPCWLRKPNLLSNGERARLDLAWHLATALIDPENKPILYDEYTSVVDRAVALSMSHCLQKFVRKHHLKIIVFSCHFDILNFLQPNWVYNLNKQVDGNVEVEWQIYADDNDYELYKNISDKDVLSDKRDIK